MKTRIFFIFILLLAFLALTAPGASGSWLIDPARFHVSAHGQLSCLDCHDDKSDPGLHPDTRAVDREISSFFDREKCLNCHDEVMTGIEKGVHGGAAIQKAEEYDLCLNCHAPHYQAAAGSGLDPAKPIGRQCGLCHEQKSQLPSPAPDLEDCYGCHRKFDRPDAQYIEQTNRLCFHCHQGPPLEGPARAVPFPLVNREDFRQTPHGNLACLDCHVQAAAFAHNQQQSPDCLGCHLPHDEQKAHDAHLKVACEACHLKGMDPVPDPKTDRIVGQKTTPDGGVSRVHDLVDAEDQKSCRRCHFPGNDFKAPAMVLPAKGVLCLPCHTATFSLGDTVTIVSLLIFILGLAASGSVWLSGSLAGQADTAPGPKLRLVVSGLVKTVFSARIGLILKAFFLDVILQQRLFKQSRARWSFHALIFYPFLLRFLYGAIALMASLLLPGRSWTWTMVDKNGPLTAFFFDLTGVIIILGVILLVWGRKKYSSPNIAHVPGPDWVAIGLLGGIIVSGFLVEGFRLAMTGYPDGSGYAFLGRALGLFLGKLPGLTSIYGYIWYLHAVLVGALFALLPFSRMFHIIMTPVVLLVNAASFAERESDRKEN